MKLTIQQIARIIASKRTDMLNKPIEPYDEMPIWKQYRYDAYAREWVAVLRDLKKLARGK